MKSVRKHCCLDCLELNALYPKELILLQLRRLMQPLHQILTQEWIWLTSEDEVRVTSGNI